MPIEFDVTVDVRYEPLERQFVARCEEFENLQGLGDTPQGACYQLREAIQLWVKAMHESTMNARRA